MTSAFALIIALAWKDVITGYVNRIAEGLKLLSAEEAAKMVALYNLYAALIVTLICVIGIPFVSK